MFGKKKQTSPLSQSVVRRRFHHFLISRRRGSVAKSTIDRPRRTVRSSPARLILLRRVAFYFVVAIAGLGLLYITLFSPFFAVAKVSVEKNGNAISGSSLSPFLDKLKGKNILFLNERILTKELEQTFRNEIMLVKIKKSYPQRVVVKVEEYPAVLNLHVITPEKSQKFIINQIGYAIFENIEQKEIPTVTIKLPKPLTVKTVIVDPKKLAPIVEAFNKFNELFGMKARRGQWKKTQRELHMTTEKNFTLWLDLTAPIDTQLMKLKRALPKLDIYNEPLEYIDLRIAGAESEKVIFRRKGAP